ncbi:DNA topoisomerase type IB small subunit [Trypanosoma theileri]|uniref:DNA topoisomerase type IB small subunit n=1 Tax=Trypanosoma theileri TaxID=67003 RepID=A0A1X0NL64_9TRYP|nr:DNA topoisomerase type IB small subunit [Trypanosoma theileri]ORC85475.1 DNA topoisomerase type IB small subunit [Trypanosoma theileri]
MADNKGKMAEVRSQDVPPTSENPKPPAALPPVKVPIKVPYILPKVPLVQPVSKKSVVPRRREESDDEDAAILGVTAPTKKKRVEAENKRASPILDESSNSDSSTDSDEDSSQSSDSDDDSSSSSGANDSSSSSSSSDEDAESEDGVSEDKLTLFEIAKEKGLISENLTQEEEKEEEAPVGPPPRPPVFRSFPRDIDAALQRYEERLNREENMIRIKDDNKAVSLGTSKINYIDPRIICSWAKEQNVPIGKIFSATIQKKFPWAMGAENFSF